MSEHLRTALVLAADGPPVQPLHKGKPPLGNCPACARSACGGRPNMKTPGPYAGPRPCHAWAATTNAHVLTSPEWAPAWQRAATVAYHPGGADPTVVDMDDPAAVQWARTNLPATRTVTTTLRRNVVQLVPAPRVEPRELRPWSPDETLTFLEAARTDPLYTAFVLAVALGLRRGEILGLQWKDVDLDRRTLTVRTTLNRGGRELYLDTTKNRRARVIPIALMCVAPLRWQRMRKAERRTAAGAEWHESDHVFTTRSGRPIEPRNLYRSFLSFLRISESAKLPKVRLHDTRHGCASLLFAAGVAPRTVMEILGHSQIAVTMNVYTHVSDDHRREAMGHMDRLLKRRR
ncbi:site-specific integrase [Streptomyces sp. NPDC048278]|uniref:tyrosine-type recombinase/integrase n=1 Tax=Streptomyces sp. NPDC048278 TaxID=3155809 RepID=UPI00341FA6AB